MSALVEVPANPKAGTKAVLGQRARRLQSGGDGRRPVSGTTVAKRIQQSGKAVR